MKAKSLPIIPLAILVLFCLWFLLFIRTDTTLASQWLGFAFGIIACLLPIIPWATKSQEYVGTATQWSTAYALAGVELIASIAIILVSPEDWKIPLFILVLILAVFFVLFIANGRANTATDNAQVRTRANRNMHQSWSSQLRPLVTKRDLSQNARKQIERAYDAIRSTPVNSALDTSVIDNQISYEVESIVVAAQKGDETQIDDSSRRIEELAQERKIVLSGLNR